VTVRVRFFASLRERLRASEVERAVPCGATVADLVDALHGDFPALAGSGRLSIAVNAEYVDRGHVLADGDEVALIPPVSGGCPDAGAPGSSGMIRLTAEPIVLDELLAAVADPKAGAVVVFIGTTRDRNEGREVERLEYEAYAGMAEKELAKIAGEARERWSIKRIAVVHRTGVVPIGMASVVIAVSSAHRADAFSAARFTIDRLKEVVPIWKKEFFAGGAVWIGDQACREGTWQTADALPGREGARPEGRPKPGV
jgi:molybdopterin converting factor subunit 1